MDHHLELLADAPQRLVLRVVVGILPRHHVRQHDAAQPVRARPAHLLHRLVHAPVRGDRGEPEAPQRALGNELRHPAIVRARAGPLQLRHHADGLQPEVAAEGRRVRLGQPVDEQDLGRDTVGIEDLVAPIAVPGAGQAVGLVLAPADRLLAHLEHLAGLLQRGHARGVLHVELGAVLRIEVVAVDLRARPGVAVGGNDEVAVHGSAPGVTAQSSPMCCSSIGHSPRASLRARSTSVASIDSRPIMITKSPLRMPASANCASSSRSCTGMS